MPIYSAAEGETGGRSAEMALRGRCHTAVCADPPRSHTEHIQWIRLLQTGFVPLLIGLEVWSWLIIQTLVTAPHLRDVKVRGGIRDTHRALRDHSAQAQL